MKTANPYDERERREILERYQKALAGMNVAYATQGRQEEGDRLRNEVSDLWDEYVSRTPRIPLSRCPFTGEEFLHSLDVYGLDGLWWNSENTARPTEAVPATTFAFTGALKLAEPVEVTSFLVKPGPEVPHVFPRILANRAIRAVVSQVSIGRHTGYPIVYFADPIPYDQPRANTWGRTLFEFLDADGDPRWGEHFDELEDYDFNLEPWIQKGQLMWIKPGDLTLRLRTSTDDCPFLGLPGKKHPQNVEGGVVWPAVDVPDEPVQAKPRFCGQCGAQLGPNARFCGSCGAVVPRS